MAQDTDAKIARPMSREGATPLASQTAGDFGVHPLDLAVPLIDGRAAMMAMCVAFLRARSSIWIGDWSIYARLQLVRGQDQRAGQDGSDEQYALLDHLRAAGLDDEAIALWQANGLALADVLGLAVRRGVDVRVLLWDPLDPWQLGHLGNDPAEQAAILTAQGISCRLDKNCRSLLHLAQGLHQKCSVVDSQVAFVGGIDFTVEYSGDFDRWDISRHPFASNLRATDRGDSPHPWHDVQVMLTGDAVGDVEHNLRQRWDASAGKVQQRIQPLSARISGLRGAVKSSHRPQGHADVETAGSAKNAPAQDSIQIIRTIPALTYRFATGGIYGIAEAYQQAVRSAEHFIYLESQYLWVEGLPKLNFTRLGWQSRKMRALVHELADAAERGVHIALVLPDHPNVGRAVTDATIDWLCRHAPNAAAARRLRFYTLATSSPDDHGNMRYRPVYVHAKVGIIDDHWATVGSANLNSRGMSHDAELCVAIENQTFARGLRQTLWAEHTDTPLLTQIAWPMGDTQKSPQSPGVEIARRTFELVQSMPLAFAGGGSPVTPSAETTALANSLADPEAGMDALARIADENLQRLRQGELLAGHLLPYLRAAEGSALGLQIERHRGLLDPLREVREGVVVPHVNRYI